MNLHNILIDTQGYLRLTDFEFTKIDIGDYTSFSLFLASDYLPPEILEKQKHGKAVDWWSLGLMIYNMVVGIHPP
jgi:serine/threonine protein kinase